MPFYRLQRGGQKIVIKFNFIAPSGQELLLRGIQEACYPFVARKNIVGAKPFRAKDLVQGESFAEAIAISFIAGSSPFYRLAALSNRAVSMAKSGQYKRLINALRWRAANVFNRMIEKTMRRA